MNGFYNIRKPAGMSSAAVVAVSLAVSFLAAGTIGSPTPGVPLLHTVSVKPWQIEKMHRTLGIYEFDDILHQYDRLKKENALCLNA